LPASLEQFAELRAAAIARRGQLLTEFRLE